MSSRMFRLSIITSLLILVSVPCFAGVRFGGFSFGAAYSRFSGPFPYYDYGLYGPFGYGYSPVYGPVFYRDSTPTRGAVQLKNAQKDAEVYINQAYAGVAKDLKTIYLDPGAYDLEVRASGKDAVQKRVYVLSGKTVKLEFGQ
jgi:hypothetical protein